MIILTFLCWRPLANLKVLNSEEILNSEKEYDPWNWFSIYLREEWLVPFIVYSGLKLTIVSRSVEK